MESDFTIREGLHKVKYFDRDVKIKWRDNHQIILYMAKWYGNEKRRDFFSILKELKIHKK